MEYLPFVGVFASAFAGFWLGIVFAKKKLIYDTRVLGLMKRQNELELEVADIRELQDRVLASHKKLQARVGMDRARRAKNAVDQIESDHDLMQRFRPGHVHE